MKVRGHAVARKRYIYVLFNGTRSTSQLMTNPTRKVQSTVLMASARFPLTLRIFKLTGLPVSYITLLEYLRDVNSFPLIKSCLIPCLFIYLFFHLFFTKIKRVLELLFLSFFLSRRYFAKHEHILGTRGWRVFSLKGQATCYCSY